eukprot:6639950-Pyramimonas_sp.AAC.1
MCCARLKFWSRAAIWDYSAACMFACVVAWRSCKYDGEVLAGGLTSRAGGCAVACGPVGEGR